MIFLLLFSCNIKIGSINKKQLLSYSEVKLGLTNAILPNSVNHENNKLKFSGDLPFFLNWYTDTKVDSLVFKVLENDYRYFVFEIANYSYIEKEYIFNKIQQAYGFTFHDTTYLKEQWVLSLSDFDKIEFCRDTSVQSVGVIGGIGNETLSIECRPFEDFITGIKVWYRHQVYYNGPQIDGYVNFKFPIENNESFDELKNYLQKSYNIQMEREFKEILVRTIIKN